MARDCPLIHDDERIKVIFMQPQDIRQHLLLINYIQMTVPAMQVML